MAAKAPAKRIKPKRTPAPKPAATSPAPSSLEDPADDQERQDLLPQIAALQAERDRYKAQADEASAVKALLTRAQATVATRRAEFDELDAQRKAAKLAVEKAIAEELELITLWTTGQQLLPYPGNPQLHTQPAPSQTEDLAAKHPIGSLGEKAIRALIGKDECQRLREIGEPVGLSEKQLETLQSYGIETIGALEERMRSSELWHRDLRGFGEERINRLINTLRVYRAKFPQPAPPDPAPTGDQPGSATTPDESHQLEAPIEPAVPATAPWEQGLFQLREILAEAESLRGSLFDEALGEVDTLIGEAMTILQEIQTTQAMTPEQDAFITRFSGVIVMHRKSQP
jgi:hypothetical protein